MSTPTEQRDNRLRLAHYLSRNIKTATYNHYDIDHNVMGYAAKQGIGGLYFDNGSIVHLEYNLNTAIAEIFGQHSMARIFALTALDHDKSRVGVMRALRNYAD